MDKLRKAVEAFLIAMGACEDSDGDPPGLCSSQDCVYCNLERTSRVRTTHRLRR